jgi:hypothetical protein
VLVWPAEATGVGELHSNDQAAIRARSAHVFFNENTAQAGQACTRVLSGNKLIGIGPAFVGHRNRFAAPD